MVSDATLAHVVLNRTADEVMCRAYDDADGRWLVTPMFIEPLPRMPGRYPCSTEGAERSDGSFGRCAAWTAPWCPTSGTGSTPDARVRRRPQPTTSPAPSSARSTRTVDPSATWPPISSRASGSPMVVWISRRSGRAP